MKLLGNLRKLSGWLQLLICLATIAVTVLAGHFLLELVDYQAVAFLLLFILSLIAAIFDRWPILVATLAAAISWNYFFIPPRFDFHIASDTDLLIFLTFFMIAFFNLILSARIRQLEQKKREELEHEKNIKLYNTILQTLSHELRTPIAGILGSLDTLNELKQKLSTEQITELTNTMQISALRLNDQVNKLLSMSRLESGALHVHTDWIDVEDFLTSLLKQKQDFWPGREIKIGFDSDLPLCKIDGALIEAAVLNLIQNAHLYSPITEKIVVFAGINDNVLKISVTDKGNGIPENEISHLFDKFYRLPESIAGGTGLGLSIVKGFVEAHGGKVEVRNVEKVGAEFSIFIPCEFSWIKSLRHE